MKTRIKSISGFTQHLFGRGKNENSASGAKGAGFTLVELLVVISIIGLLASMSTVSVNVARVKARDAKRKADLSQVQLALYLYFDDNLRFPATPTMTYLPEEGGYWQEWLAPGLNGSQPGQIQYMQMVPVDPLNNYPYIYGYNSDGRTFVLSYYLEDGGPKEFYGY